MIIIIKCVGKLKYSYVGLNRENSSVLTYTPTANDNDFTQPRYVGSVTFPSEREISSDGATRHVHRLPKTHGADVFRALGGFVRTVANA